MEIKNKFLFVPFIILGLSISSYSQKDSLNEGVYDSISGVILPYYEIIASNKDYLKKWRRTKYFVQSVYDYAVISSAMLNAFEDTLSNFSSSRKRKKYLSKANKQLKKEFGSEIRNMSITRGNYLMKLIYRNTGLTTYEIIKKYRGAGKAFWFQALCVVNGQDLKQTYKPNEEDVLIEKAVELIESGKLTYSKREPISEEAKKALKKAEKKKKKEKKKKAN
ncbi:MAG: hypothetical protein CL846_09725 [Crocinitomicaceae bacterium]|nr:hypothetical protein [Crocinitomicaceae bacterium]